MNEVEADHVVPSLGPALYTEWRVADIGVITDCLERALILELAGTVAGLRVLDVGCGDGDLALALWERIAQVTGIDASPEMIDAARLRAKNQKAAIAFEVAAAEHLPLASDQFDLVVAVTILCFVPNAAPVFQEIARVLRPGGRLAVMVPTAGRLARYWQLLPNVGAHAFDDDEIGDVLEGNGFASVRVKNLGTFQWVRGKKG